MNIQEIDNLLHTSDGNHYQLLQHIDDSKVYFNCRNILETEYDNDILLNHILNCTASEIAEDLYILLHIDNYDYPLFDFFQVARKKATTHIRFNLSIEAINWTDDISPTKYISGLKKELTDSNKFIEINDWIEDPDIYLTFYKRINDNSIVEEEIEIIFKQLINFHKKIISESNIKILCEGKTDYLHIESALREFNKNNNFSNLPLTFCKDSTVSGDGELLTYCKVSSKTSNPYPIICIFDDDNYSITKTISKNIDKDGFKDWGNNVYSVVMPRPVHRKEDKKFCIELYYSDEVLNYEDDNHRKIYLKKDFDKNNGFHISGDVICLYPKKDSLVVDSDVIDIKKKFNVALSKNNFANYIYDGTKPFDQISFEAFHPLFTVIEHIYKKSIKT